MNKINLWQKQASETADETTYFSYECYIFKQCQLRGEISCYPPSFCIMSFLILDVALMFIWTEINLEI